MTPSRPLGRRVIRYAFKESSHRVQTSLKGPRVDVERPGKRLLQQPQQEVAVTGMKATALTHLFSHLLSWT